MGVIINETITLSNGLNVTDPYASLFTNDIRMEKRVERGRVSTTTKYTLDGCFSETLYMRFNKNSGLDGLLGMKTITFWNGIFILRPLLTFSKEEIVRYAQKNNIKFFEDPSNSFLKYERVSTLNIFHTTSIMACFCNRFSSFIKNTCEERTTTNI